MPIRSQTPAIFINKSETFLFTYLLLPRSDEHENGLRPLELLSHIQFSSIAALRLRDLFLMFATTLFILSTYRRSLHHTFSYCEIPKRSQIFEELTVTNLM